MGQHFPSCPKRSISYASLATLGRSREQNIRNTTVDKKERKTLVPVQAKLTPQQKQSLEKRAQALGLTISAYVRGLVRDPKRTAEEILAREWVAVALQLRKLQPDNKGNTKLQKVLEQLKQLIQRTTSDKTDSCQNG